MTKKSGVFWISKYIDEWRKTFYCVCLTRKLAEEGKPIGLEGFQRSIKLGKLLPTLKGNEIKKVKITIEEVE